VALIPLSVPADASADVTALAPANDTTLTLPTSGFARTVSVAISVRTTAAQSAYLAPSVTIARNPQMAPDGYYFSPTVFLTAPGAGTADTFTGSVLLTQAGDYYWQAHNTVCGGTGGCVSDTSAVQHLLVVDPLSRTVAPPTIAAPATAKAGSKLHATVTDPAAAADSVVVSVASAPPSAEHVPLNPAQVLSHGSEDTPTQVTLPSRAGVFYLQAQRTACTDPPFTLPAPVIDCFSGAYSAARPITVTLPNAALTLSAPAARFRSAIPVTVRCANAPCKLSLSVVAGGRALGHRTATVFSGANTLQVKATAKAKRWLTARLVRGPRHVKVTVAATDRFKQRTVRHITITVRRAPKPKPRKPAPPPDPMIRAAEVHVRLQAASRYEISTDRVSVSCHHSSPGRYACSWSAGAVKELGQTCFPEGNASARQIGSFWAVRLFDINDTCY
jgi:hypothetical protein